MNIIYILLVIILVIVIFQAGLTNVVEGYEDSTHDMTLSQIKAKILNMKQELAKEAIEDKTLMNDTLALTKELPAFRQAAKSVPNSGPKKTSTCKKKRTHQAAKEKTHPQPDRTSRDFDTQYVRRDSLPDMKQYTRSRDMPDMSKYILKTQMPAPTDMSKYILKSRVPIVRKNNTKYILKSRIKPRNKIPNPSKYILKSKIKPDKTKQSPQETYQRNVDIRHDIINTILDGDRYTTTSRNYKCPNALF